ncbi:MAG: type II CRISPR RNA-guided endonuclease Cas9 [Erysipelotrichia bacterium]|nr:type II CRISPR RNA-guided endonuclease Cas9 [Erysipelotrichia bacterium]NCC54741.1 type II CRISPR RNA-guided endonuclease Cas9 [Erysipelotrichia bacterium]
MGRYVLGIDIGITSVGYGIVDVDTNTFVDYGVRLFKEGTAAENETRRSRRGGRRLKSRRTTRKEDMRKLLQSYHIIDDGFRSLDNPYDVRIKGLSQPLNNDELATAIFHILKHRGNSLEMVEEDEAKAKELGTTKAILKENDQLLKDGYFVCQIQKMRFDEIGKIRGNINNFRTADYVNEMQKIFSNQNVSDELKEKVLALIQRRRHYSDGPGSFISQTPYGVIYDENGKILVGMIDKMRGKCSVFPDEFRAAKMSYTAELFNFLNDLNNLSVNDEKLTKEEKEKVIGIINAKGSITPKQLAKLLGVELLDIKGFRINTKEEPILTEFKGYKLLLKLFKSHGKEQLLENKNLLDEIIDILTKSKEVNERYELINSLNTEIGKDLSTALSNARGVSGYHSLSAKAMKIINDEMLLTSMNQMQIIHSSNLVVNEKHNLKGQKNIFADDEAILSPVAKRAQREAMKVINRLREIYGEFDSIVIEMTRDKNSDDRKKRIRDNQKYFEGKNKEVIDLVGENTHLNAKTKQKIRLYIEQNGKCLYTGESLDLRLIINDPTAYEIDHILPISASLDDSMNNKVLVTHQANQEKGNLTPMMAFRKHRFTKGNIEVFRKNVLALKQNKNITSKKAEYLLYDKDLTQFSNMRDFINRNLVDTSYACRVVLNTLNDYFKQNEINTKVHTIRGKATSQFRNRIGFKKDRDEDYSHHAIDALIVASLKKQKVISDLLATYKWNDVYDEKTGEIKLVSDDQYFDEKYIAFLSELKNLKVRKFSHKIDTKANRSIADETIYSTRIIGESEKVVKKHKDIYDTKFTALADDILNKEYANKYLMAIHDPQTFDIIIQYVQHWFEMFKDDKTKVIYNKKGKIECKHNPLTDYKEEFGLLKKYSKKGNGSEITQMKYFDGELGNCLSITHKYDTKNKNVVLLQISPYRTDFYKTKENVYKFVTIRYKDVKYVSSKKKFVIDANWYFNEKIKKGIMEDAEFVCSFHRDELIGITKVAGEKKIYFDANIDDRDLCDGITPEILKFTATNDDKMNKIEVKPIYKYEPKRLMPTITKKIIKITKYSTDVLGNLYEVRDSVLKLEF